MVTLRAGAIVVLTVVGTVYALREASWAVVPIFVSALLAFALAPAVAALTRRRVPRIVASAIVYLLLALAVGGVVRAAHDQIDPFLDALPATIAAVKKTTVLSSGHGGHAGVIDRFRRAARAINAEAAVQHTARAARSGATPVAIERRLDVRGYLLDAGGTLVAAGFNMIVISLLTFLMLATGDLFKKKLVHLAGPTWTAKYLTLDVIDSINRQIERYLAVRLLISGIVAAATALPLWWIGVDSAVPLGVVAGVLNVLPILGPVVAIAAVGAAAFLQFQSVEMTLLASGIAAVVAAIEGNIITPVLTSHAGELNTVAVFLAVLFWGWLWGMWGLLLAIPIMVAAKAAADRIEGLQPIGELLGR